MQSSPRTAEMGVGTGVQTKEAAGPSPWVTSTVGFMFRNKSAIGCHVGCPWWAVRSHGAVDQEAQVQVDKGGGHGRGQGWGRRPGRTHWDACGEAVREGGG